MSDAGVTKVDCPDADDDGRHHRRRVGPRPAGRPPDHPQAHLGQGDVQDDRQGQVRRPARRHRPVHRSSSGRPASSSASQRNPNYWGKQGFAGRSRHRHLQDRRTRWSRRSRPASSTTPTAPTPSSSTSSRPTRTSQTVGRQRQRLDPARLQRLRRRHRQDHPGGRAVHEGPARSRRSATPSGYAVDHQALVDRVLGGYGDVGTTIVPPVLTQWHVEPTTPRTFDIELAKQKLDAAGYKLDASGNRLDKEGKPITLRMIMPDSDENYPKAAPVHRRLVRPARDQGHDHPGPELGRASARRSCRRKPATSTRPTTTSSCGAGAAASTRTACSDLQVRRRSAARPTASTATPTTTRCTTTS